MYIYIYVYIGMYMYVYIHVYLYVYRQAKAWAVIDRLLVTIKTALTDKVKHIFFLTASMLILLYRFTSWTVAKLMEKRF